MATTVAGARGAGVTPSPFTRALAGTRSLFPWRAVVLPWLASRVVCAAVIVGAASWPFGEGVKLRGFQVWDGVWYTAIARDGYGALPVGNLQTRWPFFPLLPGILQKYPEIRPVLFETAVVTQLRNTQHWQNFLVNQPLPFPRFAQAPFCNDRSAGRRSFAEPVNFGLLLLLQDIDDPWIVLPAIHTPPGKQSRMLIEVYERYSDGGLLRH